MAGDMLPPVVAVLRADAKQFYAELGAAGDEMEKLSKKGASAGDKLASVGGTIAKGLAVGVVGLGAVSLKMAGDFQESMTQLVTGAGESEDQIKRVSDGILKMAPQVGTSTKQLAEGMYMIESAGYHGADGLKVLQTAAEGAKVGGADLGTVANALTSALNAYHLPASQAVAVTDELVKTVGEGKMHMQDLAGSLSNVLPVAAAAHLSLAQVGGAMATMTMQGVSADQASQNLANTIRSLQAPNAVAVQEMNNLGLSSTDLAQHLGERGLTGTLEIMTNAISSKMGPAGLVMLNSFNQSKAAAADAQTMFEKLPPAAQKLAQGVRDGTVSMGDFRKGLKGLPEEQANLAKEWGSVNDKANGFNNLLRSGNPDAQTFQQALEKMMGGATGLNTALLLTGGNLPIFEANVKGVADAAQHAGKNVDGWGLIQKDFNFKLDQAKATAEELGIRLGTWLIPKVEAVGHAFLTATKWLEQHKGVAEALAAVVGGALSIAIGAFVVNKISSYISGIGDAINATRNLLSAIAALASRVAAGIGLETQSAQLGALSAALSTNTEAEAANTAATEANAESKGAAGTAAGAQVAGIEAETTALKGSTVAAEASTEAAGGLEAGLGSAGLLGALGPAAIGIGVVGGAMVLMSKHSGGAVTSIKDYTSALEKAKATSGTAADQAEALVFANDKVGESFARSGGNLGTYTSILAHHKDDIDKVSKAYQDLSSQQGLNVITGDRYAGKLREMASSGNTFAQALIQDYDAGHTTTAGLAALTAELVHMKGAQDQATSAAQREHQALATMPKTVDELTNQFSALSDQTFGLQNAQDDYNSTIAQYKDAADQQKKGTLDATTAQQNETQAMQSAQGQLSTLLQQYANHSTSSSEFQSHVQAEIGKLEGLKTQYGDANGKLTDMIGFLTQVSSRSWPVNFTDNAGQVLGDLASIGSAVRGIVGQVAGVAIQAASTAALVNSLKPHAMGGPLDRGLNLVGENGPEIIDFSGGQAMVYANPSTVGGRKAPASLLGGSPSAGGGASTSTPLHVHVNVNGRQLLEAVWPDLQTLLLQKGRLGMKIVSN